MQIAKTIINQVGNMALTMIGAKKFVAGANHVVFKIGRNSKGVSHIRISLNGADLYNMTFFNIRGIKIKELAHLEDIYAEDLKKMIENKTGMNTSL